MFYIYDQNVAKKGANDVTSMLNQFCSEILDPSVSSMHILCDSCSGQNKNCTIIRLLHYMTTVHKLFDSVNMAFPVRDHLYQECDKNMDLINQRSPAEVPDDWRDVSRHARVKLFPFEVVSCSTNGENFWEEETRRNCNAQLDPSYSYNFCNRSQLCLGTGKLQRVICLYRDLRYKKENLRQNFASNRSS